MRSRRGAPLALQLAAGRPPLTRAACTCTAVAASQLLQLCLAGTPFTAAAGGQQRPRPAWTPELRSHWDNGCPTVHPCNRTAHPLPILPNVTGVKVYNATRATGVYSHAPMLSYHDGLWPGVASHSNSGPGGVE